MEGGREERMREALERAVALADDHLQEQPEDAEVRARLAGWLMNLGRRERALAEIRRAVASAPHDVECMARAGYVHADAGDHEAATRWFRKAVRQGYGIRELERSPVLARLRPEPGFRRILEESRMSRSTDGAPTGRRRPREVAMRRAKKRAGRTPARRKRAARKKSIRKRAVRKAARKAPRKKATKKRARKAATKKSAKKKSARKKSTSAGGGGGGTRGKTLVVVLDPKKPLGARKSRLSKSAGDRICWRNRDDKAHAVVFQPGEWPFEGTQHRIDVPKHRKSEILKVGPTAIEMQYDYDIQPAIEYEDPGTPPDGPAVIVDG
jgi:plastocyanin